MSEEMKDDVKEMEASNLVVETDEYTIPAVESFDEGESEEDKPKVIDAAQLSEEEARKFYTKATTSLQAEVFRDLKDNYVPGDDIVNCFLPDGTPTQTLKHISSMPNDIREGSTERGDIYVNMLEKGVETASRRGLMYNELNNPELAGKRDWVQHFKADGGVIGALAPKFKESNVRETGERALIRVRALLGNGGQMSFPLPHTGIWVTMVSPTEVEILNFWTDLTQDRVTLGRSIYGASLANEAVYSAKRVADFAFRHIIDTNYAEGVEAIEDVLSSHDIQHLAWACACMMYQNGFLFARSVITDDATTTPTQYGRINVTKLQFIDRASLTEGQRGFLARRTEKKSKEAVLKYQSELVRNAPKVVKLSEKVEVELAVPTYRSYVDAGFNWIEGLIGMVNANFSSEEDQGKRDEAISMAQRATMLRHYDHWVKSIRVANDNISDLTQKWEIYERDEDSTIEMLLDLLTADDAVRVAFFKAVKDYQEQTCIAQICVPAASDVEVQNSLITPYPYLVPIDAVSVFISLLISTVGGVMARSDNASSM